MTEQKKLGFIQSRGLGDIIIALPIARYYADEGYQIYWPICEEFLSHFLETAPWINWIPVKTDQGSFFYDIPMAKLKAAGVDSALCLYQSLTGHPELINREEFQITKFDQVKYHAAGVPFLRKWTLDRCITRNPQREQDLLYKLNIEPHRPYVLVHLDGSDHRAVYDSEIIPADWNIIEITAETDCVFDWLAAIEQAQAVIAVDSVFSNLIDQMNLTEQTDCYFIPRSHIQLTPVLGGHWTVLDPGKTVKDRIRIFRSS